MLGFMLTLLFLITLIGVGFLSVTYFVFKFYIEPKKLVATFGILFLVVSMLGIGSWEVGKASKLSFNEYWNGYELSAEHGIVTCHKDGSCAHAYDCDPYLVYHPATYDGEGKEITSAYYTTEYHRCPYVTEEWNFSINTTLGSYAIANNWFPENPDDHRWDSFVQVSSNVPSGYPEFWLAAKNRIEAGKPGPVTKRMQYDNYLLASDTSILKSFSDKIEGFKSAGLLPPVYSTTHDFYYADKVYFVGEVPYQEAWQTALMYLNAGLGTDLQGDLHLVILNSPGEIDKDAYLTSLKAYWADPAVFGDDAISKNSIIVVLGTDGQTINWARATTGMPLGNEYMLNQIQIRLQGAPLSVDTILGKVNGEFYRREGDEKLRVRPIEMSGILPSILWGIDDPATKFVRVSMTNNNEEDSGSGFTYLSGEIQPTEEHKAGTMFVLVLMVFLVWGAIYWYHIDLERNKWK